MTGAGIGGGLACAVARLALGLFAFVLVTWGLGEAWISLIGSAEVDFMQDLAAGRGQAGIEVARTVTWAGSAVVLVPLCAVCCFVLARAGRPGEAITLALTLGGAILIANLGKALVDRPRPAVEHLQHVSGPSFPSGHATQAGAFWASLLLLMISWPVSPRKVWLAWLSVVVIVVAVAWSRLYLGVHYPSDVIAGAAIGACWAVFARWALVSRRAVETLPRAAGVS